MHTSKDTLDYASNIEENPRFIEEQLITYIGNKRSLLDFIGKGMEQVLLRTGKIKLNIFDAFSGSGVVARYLKRYANRLITNDLERYSHIINRCYLSNASKIPIETLRKLYREMIFALENGPLEKGLITKSYAPKNDQSIQCGERVFYTSRNAKYIDTARRLIETVDPNLQHYFLAPLLSEASIHANTAGVFKGFFKDAATGIGKFGGTNGDALKRILGEIHMPFPIFSNFECDVENHCGDTNQIAKSIQNMDVTYIDPPYNQHPYGSNYFMLNLILNNTKPNTVSKVSGIPSDWNRSEYNKKTYALQSLENLVQTLDSRFLLVSFNSEGFISNEEMVRLLSKYGTIDVIKTNYNTFRGSRNLSNRDMYVTEYLYLLEKADGFNSIPTSLSKEHRTPFQ